MLLCTILLLRAVHTSSGYLDLFYAHSTHQITVRSVACNKLKVSGSQLQWRNKKCNQTMPQKSEWLRFNVKFELIGPFRNECFCVSQWTACMAVST